jgi:hypothetical protein
MLKDTGVYTSKCPKCSRSTFIHLESDGSFNPKKCFDCRTEFEGITKGEQRNTFVIVLKQENKSIFGGNEEPEENKKADDETLETFSLPKKAGKKTFKW